MPYDDNDDYTQVQSNETTNQDFNWFGLFGSGNNDTLKPDTFIPAQEGSDNGNWFSDLLNFGAQIDNTLYQRELLEAQRARRLLDLTTPTDALTPPEPLDKPPEMSDFELYRNLAILAAVVVGGVVIAKKI